MAEEPDNLVLQVLRTMRAENSTRFDQIGARFDDIEAVLNEVRLTVTSHDLRFDALEERVEAIRKGTVTDIGYAAHASRGHVDLRKQIADLTHRVEKLEAGR
jgi:uncharacterized DUF497 family protein